MKKIIIIGVTGASSSGKTKFAKDIFKRLSNFKLELINVDSYYKDYPDLPCYKKEKMNFDHPDSIDYDLLTNQLKDLKDEKDIRVPIYDYETHSRSSEYKQISSANIYILEGILLFNNPKILEMLDIKIYIDTPLDICLLRRIKRDIVKRNRTIRSVIDQYQKFVRPMYFEFIEPSKKFANIIVPKTEENNIGTTMVIYAIKQLFSNQDNQKRCQN